MITYIEYVNSKETALEFYRSIKMVICPILNNEKIKFNATGFRHLIRKNTERSHDEQIFRFSLIQHAPHIISNAKEYRYRKTILGDGEIIQFWGLEGKCVGKKLRVVIRQKGNSLKHFYSIMEKASKNPQ